MTMLSFLCVTKYALRRIYRLNKNRNLQTIKMNRFKLLMGSVKKITREKRFPGSYHRLLAGVLKVHFMK